MKKVLMAFLSMFLIASIAFGTGKKERTDVFGETVKRSIVAVDAASSQWLPSTDIQVLQSTLKSVVYLPSGVIWASGYNATQEVVLRSGDNGATWQKVFTWTTTSVSGLTNIAVRDDSTAIVGTYTGYILRTQSSGAKWDTVALTYDTPNAVAFMDGVAFVGKDTAIAIGDANALGLYVTRSVDAGKTWTRLTNIPAPANASKAYYGYADYGSVMDTYGKTVWITAYSGSGVAFVVLKSTDAGTTWTSVSPTLTGGLANNYYFRSINFKDDNIGYAVDRQSSSAAASANHLHKTTDGGATWSDTLLMQPGLIANAKPYAAIPVRGTSTVIGVGFSALTGAKTWLSTDDGGTWTPLATPGNSNLTNASFLTPTKGIVVGNKMAYTYTPSVTVTFLANTAGIPDTMKTNSTVQIRGSSSQMTWDNNSPKLTNIGGDYWKTTIRFALGANFNYKFFTNVNSAITGSDNGWEADLSSGNRQMVVGNNDTTLALQFANGFQGGMAQYNAPYTSKPDSFYVAYIRVNMQGYVGWDPAKMVVGARGSFPASGWGLTIAGNMEANHANTGQTLYNGTNFYNIAVRFPKKLIDTATNAGDKLMQWKWVIHAAGAPLNEDWSKMISNPANNAGAFTMPNKDTTIMWQWYDNQAPIIGSGKDTVTIVFATDLSKAIATNSMKPGDSISVRYGFNGSASAVTTNLLLKRGLSGSMYVDTAKVIGVQVDTSAKFYYQYYLTKNGTEYREVFYDYFYTGTDNTLAEKRKLKITGKNTTLFVFDTSKNTTSINRQPIWQSTQKLARNVNVTFTCDLRPAYYHLFNSDSLIDVQTSFRNLGKGDADSVYKWGVWINGPAVGGWANPTGTDWGVALRINLTKKMYDDGTHGDKVAGDHIYTMKQMFYKDSSNNTVGQVFKFGLNAGDNEGGKGGYGNNNVDNINDADSIYTSASDFGNINPKYFRAWDYDLHKPVFVGVTQISTVPLVFALDQNYPNPFNPATVISYSIPTASKVALSVFNVLGQEVAKLVNENQTAGKYQVSFDASRFSSGVYFYRVEAGSFNAVKKMLLVK